MNTRRARELFMTVATRAGLSGSHVKPHTTRHTVCWTLSALGNRLEEVADFAGHRNPAVTNQVYIAMEDALKRSRMNIPWLDTDGQSGRERLQEVALELAGAIAGPFASTDGRTFPDYTALRVSKRVHLEDPAINEARHRAVTDESVRRAEDKAQRKESKRLMKEALRQQLADNMVLMRSLVNRKESTDRQ